MLLHCFLHCFLWMKIRVHMREQYEASPSMKRENRTATFITLSGMRWVHVSTCCWNTFNCWLVRCAFKTIRTMLWGMYSECGAQVCHNKCLYLTNTGSAHCAYISFLMPLQPLLYCTSLHFPSLDFANMQANSHKPMLSLRIRVLSDYVSCLP